MVFLLSAGGSIQWRRKAVIHFSPSIKNAYTQAYHRYASSANDHMSSSHNCLDAHSKYIHSSTSFSDLSSTSFLQMKPLNEYPIPKEISAIQSNESTAQQLLDLSVWISNKSIFKESEEFYIEAYSKMLFFEEAVEQLQMRVFDLKELALERIEGNEFYFIPLSDSDELFAAMDDNKLNRFTLTSRNTGQELRGEIKGREAEKITITIFAAKDWSPIGLYDISFELNRTTFQLQHNALEFIENHKLINILINNPLFHNQSEVSSYETEETSTMSIEPSPSNLNSEQARAIESILSGRYHPAPYLLYGPPGTGKTKTIAAAIERIVRTTNDSVLVCAQSNAACNEIAERLCKVLTENEMLRMFSTSHDVDKIRPTIRPFCNLIDGELKFPSLSTLYKFRVLICTLATSGCLVRATHDTNFKPNHFSYVFIDECPSAHETMSLVPIAGLCTSLETVHAKIILIGDPKQLDAVTKSVWATKLGFKTSWFEYLFNLPLYARNKTTGEFNKNYITQLVQNYRSHSSILKIPNQLFYEDKLKAMAATEIINLSVDGLLSENFPIIFKSVQGICLTPEKQTSSFNLEEVNAVTEFITLLLNQGKHDITQSDIGIVSPYKLQCKKIRQNCDERNYKDITIGTAEVFQGQERKVMIISTVRSGKKTLGDFLSNSQRFNVMITRAKNLLIIVGDPHLLSKDSNWSEFIGFCLKNRCLVQNKTDFRLQEDDNFSTF